MRRATDGKARGFRARCRRWLERIVGSTLAAEEREFILGDLEEMHQRWAEREGIATADRRYIKGLLAVSRGWAQRFRVRGSTLREPKNRTT